MIVSPEPLDGAPTSLAVAALTRIQHEIKAARDYAEAILRTTRDPLLVLRADLRVNTANAAFYKTFQATPDQTEGRLIYELGNGQWRIPQLRQLLEEILPLNNFFDDFEIVHDFPVIGLRTMLLNCRRLETEHASQLILLSIEDVTERVEARAAMQRSEIRYRGLFEATQDGIISLDPVSGKITDANPFMSQLLGYSRDELLGKELWQIGLLKDEQASQAAFRELQQNGFIRYEDLPLETKTGERREVEFVSNLHGKDGQKIVQCNIRDITARKATERTLAEQARLLDLSNEAIVVRDVRNRITFWNHGAEELYGWSRAEAIGKDVHVLLKSEFETPLDEIIAKLRRENHLVGEIVKTTRDGRRITVLCRWSLDHDAAGNPGAILTTTTDITERKRAEEALRESRVIMKRSEIRFRRLFEATQDGIISLDPVSRKITDSNPFMTQMLGYSREELLGKELWQIGLLKDEQASQAAFRELQHRGFIRYEYLPLETKAGKRREVEFVSNLYDEDGQQVIQCNIRDITERKRADVALRAAIDELERAQAAAERASRAKDGFLAALSHELRTPLTPVLMAAAALREDERLPADVREELGMMERNIALEARLIDDLLDLTRVSHGKLQFRAESCDAHHLIGRSIEIVQEDARAKEIAIERNFASRHGRLMADPARFQQVIWNLLRNAVKFTPKGGRISVRTREDKSIVPGETWLRIEVTDTGIGIDPARLEQIFVPFDQGALTGDHRFGGLGLGLAIARAVVELHGGRISAQSAGVNRGATITVELPGALESQPGVNDSAATPTVGSPPLKIARPLSLRLLLVEDHENTLQTLSRLLQRDGHRVVTAMTIADALTAAATEKFDLVISDLGLPDGSGTELMAQLRDLYHLRGIALSGYGTEGDIARSRDAGFITHLVKPVSIAELRRVVAALPAA